MRDNFFPIFCAQSLAQLRRLLLQLLLALGNQAHERLMRLLSLAGTDFHIHHTALTEVRPLPPRIGNSSCRFGPDPA